MLRWLAIFLVVIIIALAYFRVDVLNVPFIQQAILSLDDSLLNPNEDAPNTVEPVTPDTDQFNNYQTGAEEPSSLEQAQAQKAREYLDTLVLPATQPIDALNAKHFVTADQLINLPNIDQQKALLIPVTPITHDMASSVETTLTTESPINNLTITHDAAAQTFAVNPVRFQPSVADNDSTTHNQNIRKLTAPIAVGQTIQLRELLDNTDSNIKRIFYIHAVSPEDEQGLWGIMQGGLTETFAKGFKLPQIKQEISATIPQEADEVLSTKHSSYLGKLLHEKVNTTYIYNYEQGLVGQNPNLIKPGQQLIIVTFTEDELLEIYHQFSHR
ncbi:hypothetical protein [Neptunomonas phycophila]|uniref:hypothetical protein n=1 Tax=Neptunomonas phycophila TaxID=1572645 RepID=UPI0023F97A2A|nr:hypothetical protein [Neptunomonas phycophila]